MNAAEHRACADNILIGLQAAVGHDAQWALVHATRALAHAALAARPDSAEESPPEPAQQWTFGGTPLILRDTSEPVVLFQGNAVPPPYEASCGPVFTAEDRVELIKALDFVSDC